MLLKCTESSICAYVLTSIDDEPYGICSKRVIQRNHHHRVGVAGQLRDDPLSSHTQKELNRIISWISPTFSLNFTSVFFIHCLPQDRFFQIVACKPRVIQTKKPIRTAQSWQTKNATHPMALKNATHNVLPMCLDEFCESKQPPPEHRSIFNH